MTDFLLELRSEEIPARMQVKAKEDLARLFSDALAAAGLMAEKVEAFATPRRLALIATGLPLETEAVSEETKGPKVGAPPQAMDGFLRKTGLKQDLLVERDGVYFAVVEKPGRKTADVLAEAIPAIVRAFPWPKSQRWGDASMSTESLRWVRPLQGIVALFGDDVVECEVGGIVSGAATMGHRFHHHGPITIGNAGDYIEKLRACHVLVHFSERCRIIRDGAEAAAKAAGLVLVEDEGLVAENAGLTEWPVPMLGRFDPAFLEVPQEVIQLTARINQKYFICRDADGKLANAFVCTANIEAHDGGAAIVAGNEKVLAARLSDAKFFWEQDLKIPLETQAEKLSSIVFHEKLGSVADKVERVAKLARWLVEESIVTNTSPERGGGPRSGGGVLSAKAEPLHHQPAAGGPPPRAGEVLELAAQAERAARLAKADLVTGMVGEFPELQGIMGGYYARAQGESDAVADAVRDHYKPVGQGDDVPTAPVTVAVSLADKLDTLTGFFALGEKPTGSKDPFALRRAALGIQRVTVASRLRYNVRDVFIRTLTILNEDCADGSNTDALPELEEFIDTRLRIHLSAEGNRPDIVAAAFSGHLFDQTLSTVKYFALQNFLSSNDGDGLLACYKRAANILKQAGDDKNSVAPAKAGAHHAGQSTPTDVIGSSLRWSDADLVGEDSALLSALDTAEPKAAAAIEAEDFEGAMAALAILRAPIDSFFDAVMVNDPDPQKRAFRLGLLARFRDAVHRVADFSKIEG